MQATITAIVLTKNEEVNITSCLSSLSWCDEIIVIDDESTDKTVELAKKHNKVTVVSHPMSGGFAEQRNYALDISHGEWVLFLDADERIPLPLHYEILGNITNSMQDFAGYSLRRVDTMWGRKMRFGDSGNSSFVRLARRNAGKWVGRVHETWRVTGKIGKLNNYIEHFPHQSITDFLSEINLYTNLRAEELFSKKVSTSASSIVLYPTAKFVQNYLLKQGFRDGIQGLILALMMSFHSFLARGKLWQLWVKQNNV